MDIIIAFVVCFALLIIASIKGIFVGYTLTAALIIFTVIAVRNGHKFKDVLGMIYSGGKKTALILQIFVLIGAIISIWMASGTVQAIVYYGLKFLNPKLFVLCAFLINAVISMLIGTSFGTIGTAGVALMVMAKAGGVSLPVTAGAIIAGAYFGDRCSPMSSSANLVAHITSTELYNNIKGMIKTSIVPIVLSCIIYMLLSIRFPLRVTNNTMCFEIQKYFNISFIDLLPAGVILVLSFFRVNLKLSMLLSIGCAVIIAVFVQHNSFIQILKYAFSGYYMPANNPLKDIIKGGGILSMVKVALVVFISSGFIGIFEGTGMLNKLEELVNRWNKRDQTFMITILVSIISSAFGCTQTMAILLTNMLMTNAYKKNGLSKDDMALDLENSAIVIAPLIPWNIAVLVPLTSLGVGANTILFCIYLYILPLWNLLYLYMNNRTRLFLSRASL